MGIKRKIRGRYHSVQQTPIFYKHLYCKRKEQRISSFEKPFFWQLIHVGPVCQYLYDIYIYRDCNFVQHTSLDEDGVVDNFFSPLNTFTLHFANLDQLAKVKSVGHVVPQGNANDPLFIFEVPVGARGFKSRMCPPYPHACRKRRLKWGAVI